MKKIAVIGLGVVALLSTSTQSWSAVRKFIGGGTITAASAGCASEGWSIGNSFSMSFVPSGIGGARTSLSLFFQYGAMNFTLASGSIVGTTYKAVSARGVFRDYYPMNGVTMRFRTLSPADPTTARSVYVVGDIAGFDVPTCTISFKASGAAYP